MTLAWTGSPSQTERESEQESRAKGSQLNLKRNENGDEGLDHQSWFRSVGRLIEEIENRHGLTLQRADLTRQGEPQ